MESQSYAAAVGNFLREYRHENGLTLDAVASTAREFGATWDQSSIRRIESGKAAITFPALLTLGVALRRLTGKSLRIVDMLGDAEVLSHPTFAGLPPARAWVDRVLAGEPIEPPRLSELMGGRDRQAEIIAMARDGSWIQRIRDNLPHDFSMEDAGAFSARREPTLAEDRAAQKLGIPPFALRAWAQQLYGRSLEEEAAHRAEERSTITGKPVTAQTRGAMTRTLIKEIQDARREDAAAADTDR